MQAPQQNGWSVRQLLTMEKKRNILFDYPIQRPAGVWKPEQKSYLIHSLAQGIPVPAIFHLIVKIDREVLTKDGEVSMREGQIVMENAKVRYVLDGKQRLTSIFSYCRGEYALDASTPTVTLLDEEYEVADKYFNELDIEVQDAILGCTISNYSFDSEEVSDDEVEDLFYRLNSSTPLTPQQKAKSLMGIGWSVRLNEIGEHPLVRELAAFSPTQLKSDAHITAIIQTIMMMENKYPYKNVSQNVVSQYSITFKADTENKLQYFDKVSQAFEYLIEVFPKKERVLLKKVNFPMTVITAMEAIEKNIEPDVFYQWAESFKLALKAEESVTDIPTTYAEYGGKGTTDRPKADGRMKEMLRHFNEYLEIYKLIPNQ